MNDEATLGALSAGDGLPTDFAEFLSERFSLPAAEILPMLGRCLLEYEPQHRYDALVER